MAKYKKEGLKTWEKAKELRKATYDEYYEAQEKGGLCVACSGAAHYAIPIGLGWDVFFLCGESYGASCGADEEFSRECLEAVAKAGYAEDLCSYMRNYWGSAMINKIVLGDGTIKDKFPKANFIFTYHNCCSHAPWYRVLNRIEGGDIPIFLYDCPTAYHSSPPLKKQAIDYMVTQFMEGIEWLEKVTGRKFDDERMIEAIRNECETGYLWADMFMYNKAIPAPMNERTCYGYHGLTAYRPMDPRVVELIRELRDEIKDRAERGIADVADEQFRIIHDSNPPWSFLAIFRYLERAWGLVSIGATYTFGLHAAWDIDEEGNLVPYKTPDMRGVPMRTREEALRAYIDYKWHFFQYFYAYNAHAKSEIMKKMVKQWKADGVIIHLNRGCEGLALGQMENRLALLEEGIPVVTYEGDMADASHFDPARTREKMDTFLEGIGLKRVS